MFKLGTIIFNGELVDHKKIDYIQYHKGEKDYSNTERTVCLYVGYDFLNNINSNNLLLKNVNILKKEIVKNRLYWEFSFNEDKQSHVNGIKRFVLNLPYYYFFSNYKYINIDPVFLNIKSKTDLNKKLFKNYDNVYQFKNDSIYMVKGDIIHGINLKMFDFFEFKIDDITNLVKEKSNNFVNDHDGEMYLEYYKKFRDFTLLKRNLVVILKK